MNNAVKPEAAKKSVDNTQEPKSQARSNQTSKDAGVANEQCSGGFCQVSWKPQRPAA